MYLSFRERFDQPACRIFPYFESPASWAKLYGAAAPTKVLDDGWHAVPLAKFPFPLKARNVECIPGRRVRWIFGGFWRGVGEVNLAEESSTTIVEGFEYITAHGLWLAAPLFERFAMKREFERVWALGWERIRKGQQSQEPGPRERRVDDHRVHQVGRLPGDVPRSDGLNHPADRGPHGDA